MGFDSNLKNVVKSLDRWEDRALHAIGVYVTGNAKSLVPYITNNLKNSIDFKVSEKSVAIGTNVEYAIYVEKGTGIYAKDGNGRKTPWVYYSEELDRFIRTKGTKPQPYLTPAVENNMAGIKAIIRKTKFKAGI